MLIDCSVESKEKRDQDDDKIMFDTLIRKKLCFFPLWCVLVLHLRIANLSQS